MRATKMIRVRPDTKRRIERLGTLDDSRGDVVDRASRVLEVVEESDEVDVEDLLDDGSESSRSDAPTA